MFVKVVIQEAEGEQYSLNVARIIAVVIESFHTNSHDRTFTLGASSGEEVRAQGATHDLVELLNCKLVSVNLLDFALSFSNSAGTTQARWISFDTDRVLD